MFAYAIRYSDGPSKGFGFVQLSNLQDEEILLRIGSIIFFPEAPPTIIEAYQKQNKKKPVTEKLDTKLDDN